MAVSALVRQWKNFSDMRGLEIRVVGYENLYTLVTFSIQGGA